LYHFSMQGALEYVPLIPYILDFIRKYLTWCALRLWRAPSLCNSKFLPQRRSNFVVPTGHEGKNFFFHFKRCNLTICVVNFCKTFSTCSHNSLAQALIVKVQKIKYFFIWASWARNGSFGVFFEEKGHDPLEVSNDK
jgi:hypothetical protein